MSLRPLVLVLVCIALALPLTACGKKTKPRQPDGASYPSEYPNR